MKIINYLMILLLIYNVNAGIHYVEFEDHTGDDMKVIHVYQSDFNSQRYVKTFNLTNIDIKTIGTGRNYTLYIVTDYKTSRKNMRGDKIVAYILHNFWYWMFLLTILVIIIALFSYAYKRGKK